MLSANRMYHSIRMIDGDTSSRHLLGTRAILGGGSAAPMVSPNYYSFTVALQETTKQIEMPVQVAQRHRCFACSYQFEGQEW